MKKAIIFDLEGTLITLDRQHYITDLALKESGVVLDVAEIYKIRGFDKYNSSKEFFRALVAINKLNIAPNYLFTNETEKIIDDSIEKLNSSALNLAEKIRTKYKELRYGNIEKKDKLYSGTTKTLKVLSKNYVLGIYTARKKQSAINVLKKLKINGFFSFVLGQETKRNPEAPLKIQEKCNLLNILTQKSWLVGDSETDIKHGKQVGLRTVLVLTGNGNLALQKKTKPDYTIETIQKLPEILTI